MTPTLDAILRSWPSTPWRNAGFLLAAFIYGRGWWTLHRADPHRWHFGKLAAYLGGLFSLFLALGSPIEPFADLLLQVHMLQHLLLMMVAAPLIWLADPFLPCLRGLPRSVRQFWVTPWLRAKPVRKIFTRLTHPAVALPIFIAVTWIWHWPPFYDAALNQPDLHILQHLCFFVASLLFWFVVVRPYPWRPKWSTWLLLPFLLLADIQNTVLSSLLTFSDSVLYPHYEQVPRLFGLTALDDQSAAGVLMWVPGSIAFLAPLFAIGIKLCFGSPLPKTQPRSRPARVLISPPPAHRNWLRQSPVGRVISHAHTRRLLQLMMMIVAALVIYDGFRGPQVGAMNFAGVLPWIHWRGLLVLGLLSVGNLFCYACPFTLPRSLAQRWLPAGWNWPRWLRNKWPALILLGLFLWAYEAFSFWDRPIWTAILTISYFLAAFAVDGLFRPGSFCKYVCPIGQFNFLQSQMSPATIGVVDAQRCVTCTTHECLQGTATLPGCDTQLFQPQKVGNQDCTLCLNCVRSCPHENVSLLPVIPAQHLWSTSTTAGRVRTVARMDLAALVILLFFGAFANAAGMTAPVLRWQDQLTASAGFSSSLPMVTAAYMGMLVVLPVGCLMGIAGISRWLGQTTLSMRDLVIRFAPALIPLGFAMWLVHYCFHFFTSWETVIPVSQRLAYDLGVTTEKAVAWSCACCRPAGTSLLFSEIIALDIGLLASLFVVWKLARDMNPAKPFQLAGPWGLLLLTMFAGGIWILFQPMEMRGTLPGIGT